MDVEKIIKFIRESNVDIENSKTADGNAETKKEERMAELLRSVLDDFLKKWESTKMEGKTPGLKNIYVSKAGEKSNIKSSTTCTKVLKIPLKSNVYSFVLVNNKTKHDIVKQTTNYHIHLTLNKRHYFCRRRKTIVFFSFYKRKVFLLQNHLHSCLVEAAYWRAQGLKYNVLNLAGSVAETSYDKARGLTEGAWKMAGYVTETGYEKARGLTDAWKMAEGATEASYDQARGLTVGAWKIAGDVTKIGYEKARGYTDGAWKMAEGATHAGYEKARGLIEGAWKIAGDVTETGYDKALGVAEGAWIAATEAENIISKYLTKSKSLTDDICLQVMDVAEIGYMRAKGLTDDAVLAATEAGLVARDVVSQYVYNLPLSTLRSLTERISRPWTDFMMVIVSCVPSHGLSVLLVMSVYVQ